MAVYKHYLIIFGGIFEVTKELDDCFAFNTKTLKFETLLSLAIHSPTVSPTVSPIRKSMFMYKAGAGGKSPVRNRQGSIRKGGQLTLALSPNRTGVSPAKMKKLRKKKQKKEMEDEDALNSPTAI